MTLSDLPLAYKNATTLTLVVDAVNGGYVVTGPFQDEFADKWVGVLSILREQREALKDTGLTVHAIYYANESALSARPVEF